MSTPTIPPEPGQRCRACWRDNLDTEACPNVKTECLDCCGCDHDGPEPPPWDCGPECPSSEHLTPYDTGEVAEPHVWPTNGERERYGRVDFDNDEGGTVATVWVAREGRRYVIHIETPVAYVKAVSDGVVIETDVG